MKLFRLLSSNEWSFKGSAYGSQPNKVCQRGLTSVTQIDNWTLLCRLLVFADGQMNRVLDYLDDE